MIRRKKCMKKKTIFLSGNIVRLENHTFSKYHFSSVFEPGIYPETIY